MTVEGNSTRLDLDAILAAQWADPHEFPTAEFARAEAFWQARRAQDEELVAVRAKATDLIRGWTGRQSRDVGSFGLRLNLETSDLDSEEDFAVACRMLDEIEATMTEQEQIAHTWIKHLLRSSGG